MLRVRILLFAPIMLGTCIEEPETPPPPAEKRELAILVSGCDDWVNDVCEWTAKRKLRLIVNASAEPAIRAGTSTSSVRRLSTERWRADVQLAPDTRIVEIESGGAVATVNVAPPPRMDQLAAASSTTAQWLEAHARAELGVEARARGENDLAARELTAAIVGFQGLGRELQEARRRGVLVNTLLMQARDLVTAADVVAQFDVPARCVRCWLFAEQAQAVLALESGDLRKALSIARPASQLAIEIGEPGFETDLSITIAETLSRMGRSEEAREILEGVITYKDTYICSRGSALNNLGWLSLLDTMEGTAPATLAEPALIESGKIFSAEPCSNQNEQANVATNLARAAILRHDAHAASQELAQAKKHMPNGSARLQVWWLEVEAQIALEEKTHQRANKIYERLIALAKATDQTQPWALGELGLARSLQREGRLKEALEAFRRGSSVLDRASLAVPLGEGRTHYLAYADQLSAEYLALLIQLKRGEEAFDVARAMRRRVLASVDWWQRVEALDPARLSAWQAALSEYRIQRAELDAEAEEDWTLSREMLTRRIEQRGSKLAKLREQLESALAVLAIQSPETALPELARADDEAVILVTGTPHVWWAFVAESGVHVYSAGSGPPTRELAAKLIEKARPHLQNKKRIRLMLSGEWESIDWQSLQIDSTMLIERFAIEYSLDLQASPRCATSSTATALVIGNPTSDLPRAGPEAELAASTLANRGWRVIKQIGTDVHIEEVRRYIEDPSVEWFHFAGHAAQEDSDGWRSSMLFADRRSIEVGDVLSMARVPRTIVLAGCETGNRESVGLGLAHAFLVAGACEVIASTHSLPDVTAQRTMLMLYAGPDDDVTGSLRRAQTSLAAERVEGWEMMQLIRR